MGTRSQFQLIIMYPWKQSSIEVFFQSHDNFILCTQCFKATQKKTDVHGNGCIMKSMGFFGQNLTLGDGTTEKVFMILSGYSSRILEMRSVPIPDPVPPPRECVSWNPCRQSQLSDSFLTTSRTESTSSAPSV